MVQVKSCFSVIIKMFIQGCSGNTPLCMLEGNLGKSQPQFNSHDPLLLAAVLSLWRGSTAECVEGKVAQGQDTNPSDH